MKKINKTVIEYYKLVFPESNNEPSGLYRALQTQDTLDLQSYHPIHGWVSDNSLFMYHWGYSDEAEQIHLDEVEKVKRHINKKYKEFIKRKFP